MIHFHGTPLTPTADMAEAFVRRHAMVSFAHPQQMEIAAEVCQSVALDNGAFPAWMKGIVYDFDGFAEWAAKWIRHPAVEWCVIPDRIDGSEADNDALLRDWGMPAAVSVPVWHMHESVARQWEPDHSSSADRAKWARATEACADVVRLLATPQAVPATAPA